MYCNSGGQIDVIITHVHQRDNDDTFQTRVRCSLYVIVGTICYRRYYGPLGFYLDLLIFFAENLV